MSRWYNYQDRWDHTGMNLPNLYVSQIMIYITIVLCIELFFIFQRLKVRCTKHVLVRFVDIGGVVGRSVLLRYFHNLLWLSWLILHNYYYIDISVNGSYRVNYEINILDVDTSRSVDHHCLRIFFYVIFVSYCDCHDLFYRTMTTSTQSQVLHITE